MFNNETVLSDGALISSKYAKTDKKEQLIKRTTDM
jgi:hypothetical protein